MYRSECDGKQGREDGHEQDNRLLPVMPAAIRRPPSV